MKEGTPPYELKSEMNSKFAELQRLIAGSEKEEEMCEKTSFKGFAFEDYCERLLGQIAKVISTGHFPDAAGPLLS